PEERRPEQHADPEVTAEARMPDQSLPVESGAVPWRELEMDFEAPGLEGRASWFSLDDLARWLCHWSVLTGHSCPSAANAGLLDSTGERLCHRRLRRSGGEASTLSGARLLQSVPHAALVAFPEKYSDEHVARQHTPGYAPADPAGGGQRQE